MELKWATWLHLSYVVASSNRTFMELKLGSAGLDAGMIDVLIVPLWN